MKQNRWVIKKSQLLSWLLFIVWFPPSSIINTYSIVFNLIKFVVCGYVILTGVCNKKIQNRYLAVWAYLAVLVYSTYLQGNSRNFLLAVIYALGIISIFYYFKRRQLSNEIRKFFPITTVYLVINTLTVMLFENGITQNDLGQANYFVGGKFSVFYLSLLWLLQLMIIKEGKLKKIELIFIIIALALVSYKTDCSTAVLCLVLLLGMVCFGKIKTFLYHPIVAIAITVGSNVLLLGYYNLLQSGVLAYIVENLLHRNLNLTGRTEIYESFFILLGSDKIIGKGYNNTLISSTLGYANAQNGFLDVILKSGIVGMIFFAVLFVLSLYVSYKTINGVYYKECVWPVLMIFIVAALVEISFNTYFFFILALCLAANDIYKSDHIITGGV